MRHTKWVVTLVGALTVTACASAPSAPAEPVPSLDLSYTPPETATPGSAKVVLAIVAPEWALDADDRASRSVLGDFADALKNEFVEVLIARGFTTKGDVFSSRDELVYSDKTGSDLIITPELDVRFRFIELSEGGVPIPVLGHFAVNGTATVEGRVILNAYESVTNERVWTKPIQLEPITVSWEGESKSDVTLKDTPNSWPRLAINDPAFKRVLIPQLNRMFERVMQATWNHMDPAEFAVLKTQADELKQRARASIN